MSSTKYKNNLSLEKWVDVCFFNLVYFYYWSSITSIIIDRNSKKTSMGKHPNTKTSFTLILIYEDTID